MNNTPGMHINYLLLKVKSFASQFQKVTGDVSA